MTYERCVAWSENSMGPRTTKYVDCRHWSKILLKGNKKPHNYKISQLHWLPIRQRIMFKLLILLYKCCHGEVPIYVFELIQPYNFMRVLSSSSCTLVVPHTPLKSAEWAFSALSFHPEHIRMVTSCTIFMKLLKPICLKYHILLILTPFLSNSFIFTPKSTLRFLVKVLYINLYKHNMIKQSVSSLHMHCHQHWEPCHRSMHCIFRLPDTFHSLLWLSSLNETLNFRFTQCLPYPIGVFCIFVSP